MKPSRAESARFRARRCAWVAKFASVLLAGAAAPVVRATGAGASGAAAPPAPYAGRPAEIETNPTGVPLPPVAIDTREEHVVYKAQQNLVTAAPYFFVHIKSVVQTIFLMLILVLLIAGRNLWYPYLYRYTCGEWHCSGIRNFCCLGRLCSCCCGWCCPPYHPPFRLRIVVHEALDLSGHACYVNVIAGDNPPKTTSIQKVPTQSHYYPVIWNEPIDVEMTVADEHILFQVVESDGSVLGRTQLACAEFWPMMEGSLEEVMYLESRTITKQIFDGGKQAGELQVSLYATMPGEPLPEVVSEFA